MPLRVGAGARAAEVYQHEAIIAAVDPSSYGCGPHGASVISFTSWLTSGRNFEANPSTQSSLANTVSRERSRYRRSADRATLAGLHESLPYRWAVERGLKAEGRHAWRFASGCPTR